MKKKMMYYLLAALLLAALLAGCGQDQGESPSPPAPSVPQETAPEPSNPAPSAPQETTPEPSSPAPSAPQETAPEPSSPAPEISASASPSVADGRVRMSEGDIPKLEPYAEMMQIIAPVLDWERYISEDIIIGAELFDPEDISTFCYESNLIFEGSEELAEQIMEAGKNPGLGVRALHEQGITGAGVNVAIIDQNLLQDHPEYADRVAAYYDSGCNAPEDDGSLHAPAVLSILAGETMGVAPGAKVWFAAAPAERDAAYYADSLRWIIQQNKELPEGEKIRVVSVSAAPQGNGGWFINANQWTEAVAAAEAEGIMVLDCRSTAKTGFVFSSYGDPDSPEDVTKYQPGYPNNDNRDYYTAHWANTLFAPSSLHTTAQEYLPGLYTYMYWGVGGQSWAVPYVAGVLALGWQVNPDLDAQTMRDLLFQSAWVNEKGCHMIDPPAFIELVRETKG